MNLRGVESRGVMLSCQDVDLALRAAISQRRFTCRDQTTPLATLPLAAEEEAQSNLWRPRPRRGAFAHLANGLARFAPSRQAEADCKGRRRRSISSGCNRNWPGGRSVS